MTRRGFVRGCLLASAAAGATAAGTAFLRASEPGVGPFFPLPRRVDYLGAKLVGGPAQRGIPLLPLRTDLEGNLMGEARPASVAGGVLDWYRSCAHEATVGLQPRFEPADELLRYFATPDKVQSVEAAGEAWWTGKLGRIAAVGDFDEVGRGAAVSWRSEGQQGKNIIVASVIKLDRDRLQYDAQGTRDIVEREFLVPTPDGGALVAFVTFCPHFCCIVGWHESELARRRGQWDLLYCACHDVVCDPLQIQRDWFMLEPPAP